MKLELFDVNVFLGHPTKECPFKLASSGAELLKELGRSEIKKALVWHVAQHDLSPEDGNRLLTHAIKGEERLLGCWTILPPQTGEVITADFFNRMKKQRIFGLRAFPDSHRFLLNKVVFGKFLEEISKRRIPLLLSLAKGISWPAIYQLLAEFPQLTCILGNIGCWGMDRYTWPLLENYPNVFLETSLLSFDEREMEATVSRYGAEHLVFGTGFPERYPEASILQLLHAEIPDFDKKKIASANLERLLTRINL